MTGALRSAFVAMLREEWRLHAQLFGGPRFAAFPLLIAVITAGTVWLLVTTGIRPTVLIAGLHTLVFVFGLHTGTVGFVGHDASRNQLGDVTLTVFSFRTLPTSPNRLLGVFLVKDLLYYAALFLLPLTMAVGAAGIPAGLPLVGGQLLLLWGTITATFLLGMLVTVALIALSTRLPRWALGSGVGFCLATGWFLGVNPIQLSPYAVYRHPVPRSGVSAALPMFVLGTVSVLTYSPTAHRRNRRVVDRFSTWRARLSDEAGLLTKSLLDVTRSSGGVGKVALSGGVLFVTAAFLVRLVYRLTGIRPSPGIAFGALLGLSAFTTYNWLSQAETVRSLRRYPVSTATVFHAKARAFNLLGIPTALVYYGIATVAFGSSLGESLAGAALCVGTLAFLFGLTVALAGVEPNEFLFDTVLFAMFAGGVSLGLVPPLIVGFVLHPLGLLALVGVVGWSAVLVGLGRYLFSRSIPRWTARYRLR